MVCDQMTDLETWACVRTVLNQFKIVFAYINPSILAQPWSTALGIST